MFFNYNPADVLNLYTFGPVTIVSNSITESPLSTPIITNVQPTTITVGSTVTDYAVTTTKSLSTIIQPSCEFIVAALSLRAFLGLVLLVSPHGLRADYPGATLIRSSND